MEISIIMNKISEEVDSKFPKIPSLQRESLISFMYFGWGNPVPACDASITITKMGETAYIKADGVFRYC